MVKNYGVIESMAENFHSQLNTDKDINLIFTGSSGCMIATIFYNVIAKSHKVNLILLRKKGEKSHDIRFKERNWDCVNVFVDDHIFEGETLYRCYKDICKEKPDFIFDYIVVSWVQVKTLDKIQNIGRNLVYSNTIN